ncbi:MAG: hypothetical protein H6P98_1645 [Candidatus Aminicenantes bacterium]|nr:hypothetical protein [Candidatus Aminicenantes bacterium]
MRTTPVSRRGFMKMGLGALGGLALSQGPSGRAVEFLTGLPHAQASPQLFTKITSTSRVSLVKGEDRHRNITQALKALEPDILSSIGNKKILLKPNVVLADNPLAVTHVDSVRAILDFLAPHIKRPIIIGEGGHHKTWDGYRNAGYLELEKNYNVQLVDLNLGPYEYRYVFGVEHNPLPVRISSTCLDPDVYIISAAQMKTHNYVLITLSLKNLLLGCPIKDNKSNDKALFHTASPAVNDLCHFNMFHIAQDVFPDLAVIDGFEAMEGNGPAWGTALPARIALASLDALAADTLATKIMGFDPKRVLYLASMNEAGMGQGDLDKILVSGTPLDQCLCHFRAHEKMAEVYGLK